MKVIPLTDTDYKFKNSEVDESRDLWQFKPADPSVSQS